MNKSAEDEIKDFYKDWCKKTSRSGGVLVGSSIKELLTDFLSQISHESPVGEDELIKTQEEYIAFLHKETNAVENIAYIHGFRHSEDVVNKGQELRDKITFLKHSK